MNTILFWRAPAPRAATACLRHLWKAALKGRRVGLCAAAAKPPSLLSLTRQAFFLYTMLLASSLLSLPAAAQIRDANWFIGNNLGSAGAVFRFNSGGIQIDTIRNIPMNGTRASISDSSGNLLFYTNGLKIYNGQYQLMENGDSLNPGAAADLVISQGSGYLIPEGSIIIPHPAQENKYYLFHQSASESLHDPPHVEHLYYSLVDMNANSGEGRVELKNQVLLSFHDSLCSGQLEVVKHANGIDWWLIQPKVQTNGYYIFLIQGDSIRLAREQYIGNIHFSPIEWYGQAVFSPDGSKYARYDWRHDLEIMNFDRCTGELSNYTHIVTPDTCDNWAGLGSRPDCACGLAFSSSGNNLYVASMTNLYQYDMWAADVTDSRQTVAVYDGFVYAFPTYFWYMQLAPDGKIYMQANGTRFVHVIDFPDFSGTFCGVQQHGIFVHHPTGLGFPNFPHYRTPALAAVCEVGVREEVEAATLRLYPNPARTQLRIESSRPLPAGTRIAVYNALGQLVHSEQTQAESTEIELAVAGWQRGYYWLRVGSAAGAGVVVE